jgi:hypothetical protein
MALIPDYSQLVKPQTFSGVSAIHVVLQLDNSYPEGGYPVDSAILFNEDGFNFLLMDGYSVDGPTQFHYTVHQDVPNQRLQVINHTTGKPEATGTNMGTNVMHCNFLVW